MYKQYWNTILYCNGTSHARCKVHHHTFTRLVMKTVNGAIVAVLSPLLFEKKNLHCTRNIFKVLGFCSPSVPLACRELISSRLGSFYAAFWMKMFSEESASYQIKRSGGVLGRCYYQISKSDSQRWKAQNNKKSSLANNSFHRLLALLSVTNLSECILHVQSPNILHSLDARL